MVLEHTNIIVPRRHLIIHVDEEGRVDAWVSIVMKRRCDQAAHLLEHIQLQHVAKAATVHEVVEGLAHISSVRLVMIRDRLVAAR